MKNHQTHMQNIMWMWHCLVQSLVMVNIVSCHLARPRFDAHSYISVVSTEVSGILFARFPTVECISKGCMLVKKNHVNSLPNELKGKQALGATH